MTLWIFLSGGRGLDFPYELSRQTIHIKCQALFSLKNNKISFRMSFAADLLST